MNDQAVVTENTAAENAAAENQTLVKHCPKCGVALTKPSRFCPQCGEDLIPTCKACGAQLPEGVAFCPSCGARIDATPAPAPAVAVKAPAPAPSNKKRKVILISCIAVMVVAIAAIIIAIVLANRSTLGGKTPTSDKKNTTVAAESISLSETAITLTEGENTTVSATVRPTNATDKTVTWSSSDTNIATVNSYGRIEAVKKGTCTITATCGSISKAVTVTVKKKLPDLNKLYQDHCSSTWAKIGSDGSYLSVDSNPYDYDDGDYRFTYVVLDAIEDIHKALGLPESLYQDMMQTTWSMGKQEETFENIGIKVTWTYHPDKGMEVTYKLIND